MMNAVIPGRARSLSSGRALRGPVGANPESITPVFAFSIQPLAQGVWIPGLRQEAHPGMTGFTDLLAFIKE
jgi:hypothetical protein